ncbi:class I SAM-dependent methyltransferase [Aquisalimonas lutea]|uniref:O-methyltransferase n=1 Tax=Aquisalimonas lutea TaxID=1327750 RepID=UPI0025B4CCE8|nr:class I SAM-dependent methyltransferase [Aquisalimonas lutea]MDN3516072.1 class I SAM-dependent methyltransferase [Aquisalimonas lutea]
MTEKTLNLDTRLHDYLLDILPPESDVEARLRRRTAEYAAPQMRIGLEQARFMRVLARAMAARRVLEIGTFTGYSALAMAQALPPDGRLVTLDHDPESTAEARGFWEQAGVADRIELRLGDAAESLQALMDEHRAGTFDLAFIDADKERYHHYYECALELIRPGGVIAVDNVLWSGAVADPEDTRASTEALRAFNRRLRDDARVDVSVIPIGDGVTLATRLS